MKNLFKISILLIVFILNINSGFAFSAGKLDKFLKKSDLNNSATVAISIRNISSDEAVYEQNQKKLLHPASTLKIFASFCALEILGYDYQFKTQLYKDLNGNLYIKLGADPLLTSSKLKQAFQKLKENGDVSFKNLYFDDRIIDKKEFAQGWMWDDDINPYTPKVSAYNLDGNILKGDMIKSSEGVYIVSLKSNYPLSVISYIKSDMNKKDFLDINRYNWLNPDVVEIYGNVKAPRTVLIPVSSMRRYFIYNIDKALADNKIAISNTLYSSNIVPAEAELLAEITASIESVIPAVLQNSDNLAAESVYKLAAAKKYNSTGTDDLAENMFKEFYQNNGIDSKNIVIKDGCGVSRNNLISVDWMTRALNRIYQMQNFEQFKDNMAQPGDGTLSGRLHDLRGDAWLKTGSLSNISGITGYIKSLDGHIYSVALLIQNFTDEQPKIKQFEDEIIKIIYNR